MSMHAARAKRRRRARGGFTLVEIVAALGLITMASMFIVRLQTHTIRANTHARQLANGLQFAQMWIERFKQDAQSWTRASDAENTPAAVLANTRWLREVLTDQAVFQAIPTPVQLVSGVARISNGFDYQGQPIDWAVAEQAATLHYCVSFRPTWVVLGRAIRTDVRVWWPRDYATDAAAVRSSMAPYVISQCADDDIALSPGGTANPNYHFAYLSTVIGVTDMQR